MDSDKEILIFLFRPINDMLPGYLKKNSRTVQERHTFLHVPAHQSEDQENDAA